MFNTGFPPEWSTLKKLVWLVGSGIAGAASGIWKTVSGSLIHIADALASPMQKCEVSLEPVQAGSGDPSPDNVRPITGRTGCEVWHAGELYDDYEDDVITSNGLTITRSPTHRIKIKGTTTGGVDRYLSKQIVGTGETLKLDVSQAMPQSSCRWYVYDSTASSAVLSLYGTTAKSGTFNTVSGHIYRVGFQTPGSAVVLDIDALISVTADTLTTLSVTFPDGQTVYGGTVDLVSGVLKSKMAMVDLGDLSWFYDTTTFPDWKHFRAIINDKEDGWNNGIMEQYKLTSGQYTRTEDFVFTCAPYYSSKNVLIRDSRYTDATSFKQAVTGQKYVYRLVTPTETQLTPQEISTLRGENNVWSNGDSVEITYKAQSS